jgi:hypothetical protein
MLIMNSDGLIPRWKQQDSNKIIYELELVDTVISNIHVRVCVCVCEDELIDRKNIPVIYVFCS